MRQDLVPRTAAGDSRVQPAVSRELTISDLVNVGRRRASIIGGILLLVTALAAVYCLLSTRRYQATGTLQVLQGSPDALDLQNLVEGKNSPVDALEGNIDLQTQANILQSDTLAFQAIKALNLYQTSEFGSRFDILDRSGYEVHTAESLESSPRELRRMLDRFHDNLNVRAIGGTRLIAIDYRSPDPKRAANVVNALMDGLIDYSFQTRSTATAQTSLWLKAQMADLRKRSEDLQTKVVALQRDAGVYSLGTQDSQGRDQSYSDVLDQLQQESALLRQAQQNRILKEAIARAADDGNAELLSGLAGNGSAQAMSNAFSVVQALRQREATERASLQQAEAKFDSAYPKLAEMRAELAGLQDSISDEVERIHGRANSDFKVALQQEQKTRQHFDQVKEQAARLNDKAIEFAIARQEADQSRQLYEDLRKRLNEASVLEGLRSSNIVVVDPGRMPDRAKSPNLLLLMFAGVSGGLLLGCVASFVVDALDRTVKSVDEIEQISGYPLLGALPFVKRSGEATISEIGTAQPLFDDGIRGIPTALLADGVKKEAPVIVVTSPVLDDATARVSLNLARSLRDSGYRVLVIDADSCDRSLNVLLNSSRVADYNEVTEDKVEPRGGLLDKQSDLSILFAHKCGTARTDLLNVRFLGSLIAKWRADFDYLIVNSAPLLTDSHTLAISRLGDATVLLVRLRHVEQTQLQRSMDLLSHSGPARNVFVVANGVRPYDSRYSAYLSSKPLTPALGVN